MGYLRSNLDLDWRDNPSSKELMRSGPDGDYQGKTLSRSVCLCVLRHAGRKHLAQRNVKRVRNRITARAGVENTVLSRNKHLFCCDQNGPPARRSEPDWRLEGAYLNGYVTDEQRSRRPIFIATLWAVPSWLFFRVARSLRIDSRYARRSRLEKQPTDLRRNICLFRGQDTRCN
jgi:hypothetical protein